VPVQRIPSEKDDHTAGQLTRNETVERIDSLSDCRASAIRVPCGCGPVQTSRASTRLLPRGSEAFYPDVARRMHTEGDVVVEIVVDKSGSVSEGRTYIRTLLCYVKLRPTRCGAGSP